MTPKPTTAEPERLTTNQVAALAGVTSAAVRLYKSRGQLPEPGPDGKWDPTEIETWLASRRGRGRPPTA